ncbi:MAG TPA: hypothetical protein PKA64_16385, partial [Myxococcota bacterium]|nr:hypothetical protein [Myxococcota bacterium]
MIPLFVTALAFGGVLVGVSALLGGDGGHEVDKDIDAAADDAPDGDAEVGEAEAVDHATEAV